MQRERFRLGYRPELDGVRGLAVLAVMLFHAVDNLPAGESRRFLHGGFVGVDLFFVLSGFLITTLLIGEWQRSGACDLRAFYLRRALRLFPALAGMLLGILGLTGVAWFALPGYRDGIVHTWRAMLPTVFYVANWPLAFGWLPIHSLAMTWSLAIEEQFYLLWPALLLVLLPRVRPTRILAGLLLAVAGVNLQRFVLAAHGASWERVFFGTDTRADVLLAGCAIAVAVSGTGVLARLPSWAGRGGFLVGSIVMLALIGGAQPPHQFGLAQLPVYPLALVGAALLLIGLLAGAPEPATRVLRWGPLVGFGRISYGVYLWHSTVITYLSLLLGHGLLAGAIEAVLAVAVAILSYRLIERPLLRYKPTSRPRQESPAQSAPAFQP